MLEIVKSIAAVLTACIEFITVMVILIGAIQAIGFSLMAFVRARIVVEPTCRLP